MERFSYTNKALAEVLEDHNRIRDFLKKNGWVLKQLGVADWKDILLTNGNGKTVANVDTSNALRTLRSGVPTNKTELYDLLARAGFTVKVRGNMNAIFFAGSEGPVRSRQGVFHMSVAEMTTAQIERTVAVCIDYLTDINNQVRVVG